ncbi:DUF4351 domain-containing protein [Leptolyngbya sp. NK1-12]|uniref:DUF4351 domain-containing protein n=1 Tax=Leptolyngbya sp. NK1-12 TaxID=2547451 RepID=UPI00292F9430|nr:DUF4351 domain-containing protein [Leptolyngbya sp. NK1-12]
MMYKFAALSQTEIRAMLGLNLFEEPRAIREAKEEGKRSLVIRQLTRRVGELPQVVRSQVEALSLEQVEELGEALLDFTSLDDVQSWLAK